MGVKLYGIAGSPNVRGAMLGLAEKGVEYELIAVPPPFKDADHLSRYLFYETQAILRYVDQAFAGPALQPKDAREAARMNQILGIVDCHLFKTWSGEIAFERLIAPNFLGTPPSLEAIEAAVPMARRCAEALELLISAPYLTGENFSLADIRLLPHLAWFRPTPEGKMILADKPILSLWFRQVSERPSARSILRRAAPLLVVAMIGRDSVS